MKQVEKKLPMEEEKETKIVSLGRQKCRRKKKQWNCSLKESGFCQDTSRIYRSISELPTLGIPELFFTRVHLDEGQWRKVIHLSISPYSNKYLIP